MKLSSRKAFLHLIHISLLVQTACAAETIVHGIDEREANRILESLSDQDIQANKIMIDTGRTVIFNITVAKGDHIDAVRVLNRNELPRRIDKGYNEIFSEGGLIPTSSEERAKHLAALEGEIERQLKLIDGILDVQVQIVTPEESALRTTREQEPPTTASVTVKYLPGKDGTRPLSEPQIREVVAAGVEKLTADRVYVLMMPAGLTASKVASGLNKSVAGVRGLKQKQFNALVVFILGIIVILGIGIVFTQMRLRTVRGRLLRLQSEVAKRRKPEASAPSGSVA